jgi:hypothetical protein
MEGSLVKPTKNREDDAEGVVDDEEWQPRRPGRRRSFSPARVVVGDKVLDCVLVDASPDGAQVCLVARAALPDRVTLLLPCGKSQPMRRRWQQGSFIGFGARTALSL